jgi:hypothetical protein
MSKRLSTIRRGIEYQDLVAAEALLELVNGDPSRPVSVSLEDRRGGSFDDVVVTYADRVAWKQIKWAQNPGAEPLTIDGLAESEPNQRSMIRKFADSFRQISKDGRNFELELITNRSPDSEFRAILKGSKCLISSKPSKVQRARLSDAWLTATGLDAGQFNAMLRKLSFVVNSPDIDSRKKHLRTQLRLMGCKESSLNSLLESIQSWAQDDGQGSLVLKDVEAVLGPVLETPPNDFQLPAVRIDRAGAKDQIIHKLDQLKSGYIVVLGSPGSGKSTLLNTLRDRCTVGSRLEVIIYNCFTGTTDSFLRTRARADNFAKFLANQLHTRVGLHGFRYEPSQSLELLLARASGMLDGRKLTIIVDGLDYAARYAPKDAEGLFGILPPALPANLAIVVSAQVKAQLPLHLRTLEQSRYFDVPPLNHSEVQQLLDDHGVLRVECTGDERDSFVRTVCDNTEGHALHVNYVARQLAAPVHNGQHAVPTLATIPRCSGDIEKYYRTLLLPPENALARDVVSLMASCPFPLSPLEVANSLSPPASSRDVEDSLRPLHFLFQQIGGQFHFSHDSLRVYAERQLGGASFAITDQVNFLIDRKGDPRQGNYLLHLLAHVQNSPHELLNLDCDWLSQQVSAGSDPALLNEGLSILAIAALKQLDWRQVARYWTLQSCLQRAALEGDLTETTLISAWLAMKRESLVERYVFVSGHFLTQSYPGPDLLDLLETNGYTELASRYRDRLLSHPPSLAAEFDVIDEFTAYLRHASWRQPCSELWPVIRARCELLSARRSGNDFPPVGSPQDKAAEYVDSIIEECFYAGNLDYVEDWLSTSTNLLTKASWSRYFIRLRLQRGDMGEYSKPVRTAIKAVEDLDVLTKTAVAGGFDRAVLQRLQHFCVNPLLRNDISWYDQHRVAAAVSDLICEIELCHRVNDPDRLDSIRNSAHTIICGVGRTLTQATIRLTDAIATDAVEWRFAIDRFTSAVYTLRHARFTSDDINAAQAFVCSIGIILRSVVRHVKASAEENEFAHVIETKLLPSLLAARINYKGGHLSLADLLHDEAICSAFQLRLLAKVESWFNEDISYKSGNLIELAGRYARVCEIAAAERVLIAGVRAAFTYGYRKDTTINDFLVTFDAVAPHLGQRFATIAKFVGQAICILDDLTDGRMLEFASSYFIGLVCQYDLQLAAKLAQSLWKNCRSLRPIWIMEAVADRGLELPRFAKTFSVHAPDVELGHKDQDSFGEEGDGQYPPELVACDTRFSQSTQQLVVEVEEAIERSGFASGFYRIPGLVKVLLTRGEIDAAISVFVEFEQALRQLLQPYELPEIDQELPSPGRGDDPQTDRRRANAD